MKYYGLAGRELIYEEMHGNSGGTTSPNNNGGARTTTSYSPSNDSPSVHGGDSFIRDANEGMELHRACALGSLSHIRHLLTCTEDGGRSIVRELHTANLRGKLPIHIFTLNEPLITSDLAEAEKIAFLMVRLMGPERVVQALHPPIDNVCSGWAPFVYIIACWVERLHMGASPHNRQMIMNAVRNSVVHRPPSEPTPGGSSGGDNTNTTVPKISRLSYFPLFGPAGNDRSLISSTFMIDRDKSLFLPVSVKINDHVRWAIHILSRLIDEYPEQTREAILTNIASVPLFLKSVFLINDANEMTPLLDTSLVKHAIVDKRSINVWLIAMLTGKREIKMRAVTFLKLLSRLTLIDLAATSQNPDRYSDREIEQFVR